VSETEESILIPKVRARSKTSSSRANGHGHRKRASTLHEVSQIWKELGDDDEQAYGTFNGESTEPSSNGRPCSAGQQRQRTRRRSSAGRDLEDGPEEVRLEPHPNSLQRSNTMPGQRRSTSGKRRRRSGHEGGALFSELLKKDWWRTRRKDDEEDPPSSSGGRNRSASSSGHP
jgi:hypothetical protein